ncbi:MAG TPA: metallophosphoesterase [Tepidisphaeraceae bacterium]|nr:metallophosphoesterase [Tepidisphaeraceae bacterium]
MSFDPITRRQMLRRLAGGAAALSLTQFVPTLAGQPSPSAGGGADADFSFICLGDLHLDKLEHHDMDWLRAEKPNDVRQVENYSRITAEQTPKLFDRIRQRATTLKAAPFVLQLGDLVEGLCGTPALARKHCEDAVTMVDEARLGAPMLFTKGNHDITGPGAVEAFDDVLLPWMKHPGIERQRGANFTVDVGPARFVFFDAYETNESLAWLPAALEGRTADTGPTFFVVHPPVVPYTARCWHVFNRPAQSEPRQKLLALLGQARAIVLNGHLHRYGLVTRTVASSAIEQFSTISVIPDDVPRITNEARGADAYGPGVTDLEPRFSPDTLEQRKQTLEAEKPFVTRYEHANAPGYSVIHVRGRDVTADYYTGTGDQIWRSVQIASA